MARRDFGSIRRRDSGRYQARYRDPAGRVHTRMFATRGDAARYLAGTRADLDRGEWFDPSAGRQLLADYAPAWVKTRRVRGRPLAPRTVALYEWLLAKHILPTLGALQLRQLTPAAIRGWHRQLLSAAGPGSVTAAKCYRLLRSICHSAVDEQEIAHNPCAIPGAGQESSPERPIATVPQVLALAEQVDERWRALVLLAAFCSLRFGELAALTRDAVDIDEATVSVRVAASELPGGVRHLGPPKSDAGRRVVTMPAAIVPVLDDHLRRFAQPGADGLVFVGPRGGVLRRNNFASDIWHPAAAAVGVPQMHFHDLRHTGNTLAAATGASLRELMVRMGHASPQAALRYQHATRDRDAAIAHALSALVEQAQTGEPAANSGVAQGNVGRRSRRGSSSRKASDPRTGAGQETLFPLDEAPMTSGHPRSSSRVDG